MITKQNARAARLRRRRRIRNRLSGTPARQRLSVFRSGKHIYAQIIDDMRGHTLVAASSLDGVVRSASSSEDEGHKTTVATQVGRLIGERAQAAGIMRVAFDRGGFVYHGRIKALAEGARAAGLEF